MRKYRIDTLVISMSLRKIMKYPSGMLSNDIALTLGKDAL